MQRVGPLSEVLFRGIKPACYCAHCVSRNAKAGIDAKRAKAGYRELYELIHALEQGGPKPADGVFAAVLRVLGQFQKDKRLNRMGNQAANASQRDFRIETAFDADMKTGDVNVPAFSADLLGAKVRAKLAGKNMHTDKPALNGSVDASGTDLALLMRTAGVLDPKSALLDYGKKLKDVKDRSFQVKTDFNADLKSGNVDLPALDARALGLTVAGKMAAKNMESSSGSVNGELSVRGGQLGELLRAVDQADLADTLQSVELDARISGSRRASTARSTSRTSPSSTRRRARWS